MMKLYAHIPAPNAATTLFRQYETQTFLAKDDITTFRTIFAMIMAQPDVERLKYVSFLFHYGFGSNQWHSLLASSIAMNEHDESLKNFLIVMNQQMNASTEDLIMGGINPLIYALKRESGEYIQCDGDNYNQHFSGNHTFDWFLNGFQHDIYSVMFCNATARCITSQPSLEWCLWRRVFTQNPRLAARLVSNQMHQPMRPLTPVQAQTIRLLLKRRVNSLTEQDTFHAMIKIGNRFGGKALCQYVLRCSLLGTQVRFRGLHRDISELDAIIRLTHLLGMQSIQDNSRWIQELHLRDRKLNSYGPLPRIAVSGESLWIATMGLDLGFVSFDGQFGKIEKCSKV